MISNTEEFWDSAWKRHSDKYIAAVSRQAYYLYFLMGRGDRTCLELGAGSFRDTATLNKWGYKCTGTDFSEKSLLVARENYKQWSDKFFLADATSLPFEDKAFDVSFHNGLLVCFQDNAVVGKILAEQARVTRRLAVSTVHNRANLGLIQCFKEKARADNLYDIRFFQKEELIALMGEHFDDVKAFPFGLPWLDRLIGVVRNRIVLKVFYHWACRRPEWHSCERIMVAGRPRERTPVAGGSVSRPGT